MKIILLFMSVMLASCSQRVEYERIGVLIEVCKAHSGTSRVKVHKWSVTAVCSDGESYTESEAIKILKFTIRGQSND